MKRYQRKTERGAAAAELVKRIEREEKPHVLTRAELRLIPLATLKRLDREGRLNWDNLNRSKEQPHHPDQTNMPGSAQPRSKFEIN